MLKSYKQNVFIFIIISLLLSLDSQACTRVLHVFKNGDVVTGRSMDWYVRFDTSIWKFPRNLKRDGLTPKNPAKWTSKYGSVVITQTTDGESAATDGINEKGLVANLLYLSETKYAKRDIEKSGIASSIYLQFLLDNFATVKEATEYIKSDKIQIVPVPIPNSEHLPTMHISISDANGDSAIIEFLNEKVVIHHSKKYQIMTNSPTFEKQLTLTSYWSEIDGNKFLPGTRSSADRFVRATFYNKNLPQPKTYKEAIAGVMSVVRNVSSPFGDSDPKKPNISSTLWRTVADNTKLVYYFESTISPNLIWINLKDMDFSHDAKVLEIKNSSNYYGNVTKEFKVHQTLEFAKVPNSQKKEK